MQWRQPEFLMPALNLLKTERSEHLAIAEHYAGLRRTQKQEGRRSPSIQDVTPTVPRRWHGDERQGALLFLHRLLEVDRLYHRENAITQAQQALRAAEVAVGGDVNSLDRDHLQSMLDWSRHQVHVVGWTANQESHAIAWQSLRLLGQIHLLVHGATAVATPWNFATRDSLAQPSAADE